MGGVTRLTISLAVIMMEVRIDLCSLHLLVSARSSRTHGVTRLPMSLAVMIEVCIEPISPYSVVIVASFLLMPAPSAYE